MSPALPSADRRARRRRSDNGAGTSLLLVNKTDIDQGSSIKSKDSRIGKDKEQTAYNLRPRQHWTAQKGRQGQKEKSATAERRKRYPEEFPDLDFHNSFGAFLTRKNPVSRTVDHQIAQYWQLLSENSTLLQLHHIHEIGDQYREAFQRFFGAEPISLHRHVSDASNPALLTSLISHLVRHTSRNCKIAPFDVITLHNPRIAITEGSYGAGYGHLAYDAVVESVRPLGNGPRPDVISTGNAAKIGAQMKAAKSHGCIALIAEIVSARDGRIISDCMEENIKGLRKVRNNPCCR